jgi:hypothetical protein
VVVVVAVVLVVAHLGFAAFRRVTGRLNDLFNDVYLLVVGRARLGRVDGVRVNNGVRLLVGRKASRGVNGGHVDNGLGLLEGRKAGRRDVDGGAGYGELLAVVGLETGTILALSNVNGSAVSAAGIDLEARLGVSRLRSVVLLSDENKLVFVVDAGTAGVFLFTSDADLFFSEATLFARRRKLCLRLERRVLTFPSGVLGELDLNLFVDTGLSSGLGLPV